MDITNLPTSALVAIRTQPAALAEIARRVAEHGPGSAFPAALAKALGVPERTLRRVLGELDAAGYVVAVGWIRAKGGGARNAREKRASKKIDTTRTI